MNTFYVTTGKDKNNRGEDKYTSRQRIFKELYNEIRPSKVVPASASLPASQRPSPGQISSIRMGSRSKTAGAASGASSPASDPASASPPPSASPPSNARQKSSQLIMGLRNKNVKAAPTDSSQESTVNTPDTKNK